MSLVTEFAAVELRQGVEQILTVSQQLVVLLVQACGGTACDWCLYTDVHIVNQTRLWVQTNSAQLLSCSHWRKIMSMALSPSSIERYLPALQQTMEQGLSSWAEKGAVPLMEAVSHRQLNCIDASECCSLTQFLQSLHLYHISSRSCLLFALCSLHCAAHHCLLLLLAPLLHPSAEW